jgi:hypothetical protein
MRYSPLIRHLESTVLASQIVSVVLHAGSGSLGRYRPSVGARIAELLDSNPCHAAPIEFLKFHADIMIRKKNLDEALFLEAYRGRFGGDF